MSENQTNLPSMSYPTTLLAPSPYIIRPELEDLGYQDSSYIIARRDLYALYGIYYY
jgi:hypothetical protein